MAFSYAVIGINHGHIHMQIEQMEGAGCHLKSFYAAEDELAAEFIKKYPHCIRVRSEEEILSDPDIRLILGAGIPNERAEMGIRAMRMGKDVMVDKLGAMNEDQLKRLKKTVQATGRFYSIFYCERFHQRATLKAADLISQGVIGDVVNVICVGPHKLGLFERPEWFYKKKSYGGILADIGTHMIDQFLFFTHSDDAVIHHARATNIACLDHPEMQDFGEIFLTSKDGQKSGYIKVDWLTPASFPTWGDGRLFLQGTKGALEIRKYIDIAHPSHEGENHLYLTTQNGVEYINCNDVDFSYGADIRDDVLNRTQKAMRQEHCFKATELALQAQKMADKKKWPS